MSRLFNRSYKLTIDDIEIEGGGVGLARYGLDVRFKVQSSIKKDPNKIEVDVYNLNPTHRSDLMKQSGSQVNKTKRKPVAVQLEAGYADDRGVIFRGELRNLVVKREGDDFIMNLTGSDAGHAFTVARLSKCYAPGTTVFTVAQDALNAMGVGTGNLSTFSSLTIPNYGATYAEGYAVNDSAEVVLTHILHAAGLTWSVQKGVLQVKKRNQPVDDQVYYLSADSGLIGTPTPEIDATVLPTTSGAPKKPIAGKRTGMIQVRSLLIHQLYPGAKIELDSESFKGGYQVTQLINDGESDGDKWFSDLLVRPY